MEEGGTYIISIGNDSRLHSNRPRAVAAKLPIGRGCDGENRGNSRGEKELHPDRLVINYLCMQYIVYEKTGNSKFYSQLA